jgi:uracil-DNA glycosylase family protein
MAERAVQLEGVRTTALGCTNCELYRDATQMVFGKGPVSASLLLVGEQPGDKEDRAGLPFVGPAGAVLDDALMAAGIERSRTYVTNAVKHFRFSRQGKRRIHQKPNTTHIVACRPWLESEIDLVDPDVVVALGATAAQSLLGKAVRIGTARGQRHEVAGRPLAVTVHPSSLLRTEDPAKRAADFDAFVADLRSAAAWVA